MADKGHIEKKLTVGGNCFFISFFYCDNLSKFFFQRGITMDVFDELILKYVTG